MAGRAAGTGGSAPQVITQPGDQSVQSGQPATFVTVAGGVVTGAQWQVSTDAGADWSNVPYATAMSYSFLAAAGENGYEYRAVLSNSGGTTITRAATLTVTVPAGGGAPQVTTQPTNQTVLSRKLRDVHRGRVRTPAPSHPVAGFHQRRPELEHDHRRDLDQLHGSAQSGQNGYEYRAVFTNGAGTVATNAASLVVAAGSITGRDTPRIGQGFSTVTGSWTGSGGDVPGEATTYSSQWIGIDGAENGDNFVEQDGTESDCLGGAPSYDAWYEMYGDPAVNGGDEVELSPTNYPYAGGRDERLGQPRGLDLDARDQRHHRGLAVQHPDRPAHPAPQQLLGRMDPRAARDEQLAVFARRTSAAPRLPARPPPTARPAVRSRCSRTSRSR